MALAFWRFTRGLLVFLCLLYLPISEAQNTGLYNLSINCGATAPYTDNVTKIKWVPDHPYITTGMISNNVTSQAYNSSLRHKSLRYFPEVQISKFCYKLNATTNTTYLIRTTFLYGAYDGGVNKPAFQLHIDTYNYGLIDVQDASDLPSVIEITMTAVAKNIYVCLAPNTSGIDVPFINSIELRELGRQLYPKARQGYMMFNNYRYNFGGENISYPNDLYDRHWRSFPGSSVPFQNLTSAQRVIVGDFSRDEAPPEVLNTAMAWNTRFEFPFNVSGGRNYAVFLWLAEIDPKVRNNVIREFEVGVDGMWEEPINIVNETNGVPYQAYEWVYPSKNLTTTSILTLRATNRSSLGPILNGLEVFAVSDPVQPRTHLQDAIAIEGIKTHFNMTTWVGDPCLYSPYDWISCSTDTSPRITQLHLQGYNLTGSIPLMLRNLTQLTRLWLENNTLHGSVPDLSALTKLQHLHLQHNHLSGAFPAWVVNLTALRELYVEGNNFTGFVPPSLFNKTGLKFTYTPGNSISTNSPAMAPVPATRKSNNNSSLGLLIGCVVAGVAAVNLIFFAVLYAWCGKQRPLYSLDRDPLYKDNDSALFDTKAQTMAYSFNEVKEATNNFKDQIGEGGFGPVYKGRLSDAREVAVKRCRPSNKQGTTEFFNQVELLSKVHHRNLAPLIGYCQDEQEHILLYEYMSNCNLRTHLHGDGKHLPWSTRLAIALDAAQGLEYLHTGCRPGIIHRDVKPNNILLTRKMVAKVTDFGLTKFTSEVDSKFQVYTDMKGTTGYLDPEYAISRRLTEKSDVYSFGVVLLELISGQEPMKKTETDKDSHLIERMRPLIVAGNLKEVVDPSLGDKYNLECMWKVAELGMTCVEPRDFNRPTMAEVVQELRDAIAMEEAARVAHHPASNFSLASVASRL